MFWGPPVGLTGFVRCPRCGTVQYQMASGDSFTCSERGCRRRFTRAEGRASLRSAARKASSKD